MYSGNVDFQKWISQSTWIAAIGIFKTKKAGSFLTLPIVGRESLYFKFLL